MLNERIASEIEMMSQEALIYLQEQFEKDLDSYFTADTSQAQAERRRLQSSSDKIQSVKEICKSHILTYLLLENLKADTTKIIRGKIEELCSSKAKQTPQKPLLDSILEDISQSQIKPLLERQQTSTKQSPEVATASTAGRPPADFSNCFIQAPLQDAIRDAPQVSHFGSMITPKKSANQPVQNVRL